MEQNAPTILFDVPSTSSPTCRFYDPSFAFAAPPTFIIGTPLVPTRPVIVSIVEDGTSAVSKACAAAGLCVQNSEECCVNLVTLSALLQEKRRVAQAKRGGSYLREAKLQADNERAHAARNGRT